MIKYQNNFNIKKQTTEKFNFLLSGYYFLLQSSLTIFLFLKSVVFESFVFFSILCVYHFVILISTVLVLFVCTLLSLFTGANSIKLLHFSSLQWAFSCILCNFLSTGVYVINVKFLRRA